MEKFVKYQDVVNTFLRGLYVDGSVTGAQSLTEAFELYLISKKLMKGGGSVLKKWTTNNDELREKIHTAEKEIFGEEDEKIEIRCWEQIGALVMISCFFRGRMLLIMH